MVATVPTPIYLKSVSKARHCAKCLHYFLQATMVSRYYLHFTNEETVFVLFTYLLYETLKKKKKTLICPHIFLSS